MSPVDSDTVEASDFAATFGKLDAQPGVKIVSSYAALTSYSSGFSVPTAHHGETALDTSTKAQWWWNCPSGAGSWQRVNTVGLLSYASNATNVSSSATSGNGSQFCSTGNFTTPGGRPIRIETYVEGNNSNSNNNGLLFITVMDNGAVIIDVNVFAGPVTGSVYVRPFFIMSPGVNSVHNISAYVRSSSASASNGGGATSTVAWSSIAVTEV